MKSLQYPFIPDEYSNCDLDDDEHHDNVEDYASPPSKRQHLGMFESKE